MEKDEQAIDIEIEALKRRVAYRLSAKHPKGPLPGD